MVTAAGFRDPPTTAGMTRSSVSRNVSRSDGAIPKMRYWKPAATNARACATASSGVPAKCDCSKKLTSPHEP